MVTKAEKIVANKAAVASPEKPAKTVVKVAGNKPTAPAPVVVVGSVSAPKMGVKTTELWITMLSTVLMAVWPAFPKEGFMSIVTWVIGRSSQKMFGLVDAKSSKAAWQTSEFWVSIVYAILVTIFPDIPAESLYAVQGWVAMRIGIKVVGERKLLKNGNGNGTISS